MNNIKNHNFSNEIQIEIDDVYACPGHCPGCVLSSVERKGYAPDMDFSTLQNSITKLKEYVSKLSNLEKINLTYGIADHFLMDNSYLEKTYLLGADLIESANLPNKYNGVFYTASMIGKHEHIMEKIKFLHSVSQKRGVPFYIIAVLDPKNLYHKKFGEIYAKNILEANKLIGKVDLSINLSEEAIDQITPQELYDFALLNDFDEVTINWVPTDDNIKYVYFNQDKLAQWLIDFDNLVAKDNKLGTSYRPVMIKTINNIMCKSDNYSEHLQSLVKNNLQELVMKSIQIDHTGSFFPKYEAIGDIAHNPRFGIQEWGNVNNNIDLHSVILNKIAETEKFVIKQFTREPCLSCEYNKFCANSGFHIYNHVLNKNEDVNVKLQIKKNIKDNGCYHMAKKLFTHYYEQEKI